MKSKDEKNKKPFAESDVALREILAQEIKKKVVRKIDDEDPTVMAAIKQLLADGDEPSTK
jgi:hypothetical protein